MAKFFPILFFTVILCTLSSCKDDDQSEIAGRYQGQKILSGGITQQVVAQVPTLDKSKSIQVNISQTLASVKSDSIFLRFESQNQLWLRIPTFGEGEVSLSINKNCARGPWSDQSIEFCWGSGKLDLEITSSDKQVVFALHLIKDDTLPAASEPDHAYSLDELAGRAKFFNYTVSQEAERVFRAKQTVKVAVGNLLPHFNMRDLLAFGAGGPIGLIGSVGNFLPFLFPNNWFKWKASKQMAQAERKSFASLRGNQTNAVVELYYFVTRDQALLKIVDTQLEWLKEVQKIIDQKEQSGALPAGSADYFNIRLVTLAQDQIQLQKLVSTELSSLAEAVALSPIKQTLELVPIKLPNLSEIQPIDATQFYKEAQIKSYEVATLEFLVQASRNLKKEVAFGFLDPSSDQFIGFGYGGQLRIGKSQENELKKRKNETLTLIELRSVDATTEFNNSLKSFRLADSGLKSGKAQLKRNLRRLVGGDDVLADSQFLENFILTADQVLKFEANRLSAIHAYLTAATKIDRLLLKGFYEDLESVIPDNQEALDEFQDPPSSSNFGGGKS